MTLYRKLQSALNKVGGNTLLIESEETSKYDEYFCVLCKNRVYEEAYNHKHKCCFKCFYEESDHTRADDGDAPEESE